ncbi:MAG: hypothetical protein A3A58_02720 [Candidatus Blackburnbacteria bacterium RIFCSPLOWO2_01_FULL_41_27]|uniref:Uncharacterized protein n=2 Tax=Candidatus Blackburniibacteriota TaxID=1817898 RepID=A0A1G1VAJ7_9BACT|nr:MAG: hypothetical protein A3H79_01875 [Candidatus Levybacteria bacterium RIFCSPLOWO2_02_FULL_36_8b]OGY12393.1 MAG: hypothetical protein A3F61_03790 [Candidatus Blackburnbacteria bacterium RIFCSPHIGHO2_12_FULL_41_13b]OGY14404.1 MAG: hypothetical protein A3A58_02720 [Candidatus Blackburnbacteria bacterium RIFCSPLOWO2_01_FULL_41_27]
MSTERYINEIKGKGLSIFIPESVFTPKEGQILGAENIKLGGRYLNRVKEGSLQQITVVKAPFNEDGETWVVAIVDLASAKYICKISLADRGVIPYPGELMNAFHYLTLDESAVPDRESEIKKKIYEHNLREAAVLVLAGAVEAEDPSKRLACLKTFALLLDRAKLKLEHFELNMTDIIAIANVAYQQPDGSRQLAQAIHFMASDALSLFPQDELHPIF